MITSKDIFRDILAKAKNNPEMKGKETECILNTYIFSQLYKNAWVKTHLCDPCYWSFEDEGKVKKMALALFNELDKVNIEKAFTLISNSFYGAGIANAQYVALTGKVPLSLQLYIKKGVLTSGEHYDIANPPKEFRIPQPIFDDIKGKAPRSYVDGEGCIHSFQFSQIKDAITDIFNSLVQSGIEIDTALEMIVCEQIEPINFEVKTVGLGASPRP